MNMHPAKFALLYLALMAVLVAVIPKPAFGYWECENTDWECRRQLDAYQHQQRWNNYNANKPKITVPAFVLPPTPQQPGANANTVPQYWENKRRQEQLDRIERQQQELQRQLRGY